MRGLRIHTYFLRYGMPCCDFALCVHLIQNTMFMCFTELLQYLSRFRLRIIFVFSLAVFMFPTVSYFLVWHVSTIFYFGTTHFRGDRCGCASPPPRRHLIGWLAEAAWYQDTFVPQYSHGLKMTSLESTTRMFHHVLFCVAF